MKHLFLILAFVLLSAPQAYAKKTLHPGAHKEGFYSGISGGRVFYTGTDRTLFQDAWVTGFRFGYDFYKYLGVEAGFKISGHEATTGTGLITVPKSFFVFQGLAIVRGSYPIIKRLYINAGVGGGLWYSSPNQKTTSSSASRGMFYGDLGIEYFLRNRGVSIGLDPSLSAVQGLKGAVVQFTGFVRYTF
jgi:hypothetical protein